MINCITQNKSNVFITFFTEHSKYVVALDNCQKLKVLLLLHFLSIFILKTQSDLRPQYDNTGRKKYERY